MRRSCFFLTSAPHLQALPQALVPEMAFWGRSNVGKSSVLNALMGQTAMARVSKRPGCTQAINFFHFSQGLHLVDLPGYGFAKVPPSLQRRWEGLVPAYLQHRATLRHLFLLIDSRHPPQPADELVLGWLAGLGRPYSIVLTKTDRLGKSLLGERIAYLAERLPKVAILPVSAKHKSGFDPIRAILDQFDIVPATAAAFTGSGRFAGGAAPQEFGAQGTVVESAADGGVAQEMAAGAPASQEVDVKESAVQAPFAQAPSAQAVSVSGSLGGDSCGLPHGLTLPQTLPFSRSQGLGDLDPQSRLAGPSRPNSSSLSLHTLTQET